MPVEARITLSRHLCLPPQSNEQISPVAIELGWFSLKCMPDALKYPSDDEHRDRQQTCDSSLLGSAFSHPGNLASALANYSRVPHTPNPADVRAALPTTDALHTEVQAVSRERQNHKL